MKISISPPGRYVIAASGGVDSMALLDILAKMSAIKIVVAHFNHGIRPDSAEDEKLVVKVAKEHKLPVEVGHGELGPGASEEQARNARYKFLESVSKKYKAKGIITAHHQDDLIETAFINILRGTGRSGLSSIVNSKIYRPFLSVPKKEILVYAKSNKIQWREDTTNADTRYLRNYIRQHIMTKLSSKEKAEIINNLDKVAKINEEIDKEIATLSHVYKDASINRRVFIMLPAPVGEELLVGWLKQHNPGSFDKKTIKRLSTAIKTGHPGSVHDVAGGRKLRLTTKSADLI